MEHPFCVLLYYKFVAIEDHVIYARDHLALCKSLGLKGRIIVASEGINGTVSGSVEACNAYREEFKKDERFYDMVFKVDEASHIPFKKMFVRPRRSIITLHESDEINPSEITGKYLKPSDFYQALQQEDVIVIDGRNDYEYEIGHFRNAIKPDVKSFRDFPKWIKENKNKLKDKKIITYCTGGVRCEKLTGLLMNEGYQDVSQLEGGIVTYGKDPVVKGRLWDGKCYVFDERISVKVNRTDEDIVIGTCTHCQMLSDRYINCFNDDCHLQHISCLSCEKEKFGFCSDKCQARVKQYPVRDRHFRM